MVEARSADPWPCSDRLSASHLTSNPRDGNAHEPSAKSGFCAGACLDRADRPARRSSLSADDSRHQGGARHLRRAGATHFQHFPVRDGICDPVLRLTLRPLRAPPCLAFRPRPVPGRKRHLCIGGRHLDARARPLRTGRRRRQRHDLGTHDRPRRLWAGTPGQRTRLPDDVLYAGPDGRTNRGRLPRRYPGLAERVRLRAGRGRLPLPSECIPRSPKPGRPSRTAAAAQE